MIKAGCFQIKLEVRCAHAQFLAILFCTMFLVVLVLLVLVLLVLLLLT